MKPEDKRRILAAQDKAELMARLSERGFYIVDHQPLPIEAPVVRPEDAVGEDRRADH